MTVQAVAPEIISCRSVGPNDPTIQAWLATFMRQATSFSHVGAQVGAGAWIGLYGGDRLLSAFGYTHCVDGTVFIEHALCEPSRAGAMGLRVLAQALYQLWHGSNRMRFFCERRNRRMRRIVEGLGAVPQAFLYEIGVQHGQE